MTRGWLFFSVVTLLLWGVWGFLPKVILQTLSMEGALFYEALGAAAIALPMFAFLRFRLDYDRKGYAISAVQAALSVSSLLAFYTALKMGPVSVIVTMTALYPVVSVLLAAVFLKEKISAAQGGAVGMAVFSVWLLAG